MSKQRNTNPNYEILDKILADADRADRQGNGVWIDDPNHPDGGYILTKEAFDRLTSNVNDIERSLRSS